MNTLDPSEELHDVNKELEHVAQEIADLLEKQSKLYKKKKQLEELVREEATKNNSEQWQKNDFPWAAKLEESKNVFGIKHFRPLQMCTMNATLSKKDCILVMPTGGGKSLCFQLPAVVSKGVTLVVCPLISLMEDQVMSLQKHRVSAELLTGTSSKQHSNAMHTAMSDRNADLKLLYVTPEKLAKSKRFMNKLEAMYEMGRLDRIVIDEVHCCSHWGHDFRPDYKFLGILKKQFPGVPILGLTATAGNHVLHDVKTMLNIETCVVFRSSFNRPNLFYKVLYKPTKQEECIESMAKLISSQFDKQSGIVYCLSQKDTEQVSNELKLRGIKARPYHANLDATVRSDVHKKWINNTIQIVVATIAFGMGIDKPDVRFVIHHSISKSVENYYQESGRAGRDDNRSECILYTNFLDIFRQSTMVFYSEQTGLEKLYAMVSYASNTQKCRRGLIAGLFGEVWNSELCNKMCDHCQHKENVSKRDVTQLARDVVFLLNKCSSSKKPERLTPLKLLDLWTGKKHANLRDSTVKPPKLTRRQTEQVLVHLLLERYLKEDFHFTAYTTISYIVTGPKSNLLKRADHCVEMRLEGSAASCTQTQNGRQKTDTKVKPSIIGTNVVRLESSSTSEEKTPAKKRLPKKSPVPVLDLDSDSDLDFGESYEPVLKKSKRSVENTTSKTVDIKKAIVIDSDEDSL